MPQSKQPDVEKVVHDPEFLALVAKRNAISFTLTAIMLVVYFGFAAILAFNPKALAAPFGNTTLGIPFGIGVIIIACILTGIYVRWANTEYDSLIKHLNARLAEKEAAIANAKKVAQNEDSQNA